MRENQKIKIGFFGTPEFSLTFLRYVFNQKFKISFIVSQPPARSGRGKKKKKSPVQSWAEQNGIKIFVPETIKDKSFKKEILEQKIDFILVVAYGNMITDDILNLPKYYSINVHASLLPRWRGAAPIHRAILSGDQETGVSIMKVEKKLDSGPVFKKSKIKIEENDTSEMVLKKIISRGKTILLETLYNIIDNKYELEIQDTTKITYAHKIKKNESKINWNEKASQIILKINAFYPSPGAWTYLDSGKRVKILKARVVKYSGKENKNDQSSTQYSNDLIVKCGEDYLLILLLQVEGKRPVKAKEFINGYKSNKIFPNDK